MFVSTIIGGPRICGLHSTKSLLGCSNFWTLMKNHVFLGIQDRAPGFVLPLSFGLKFSQPCTREECQDATQCPSSHCCIRPRWDCSDSGSLLFYKSSSVVVVKYDISPIVGIVQVLTGEFKPSTNSVPRYC